MIIRKNGVRIICSFLVVLQCLFIMTPYVEALGSLDFSSSMMTSLINDNNKPIAPGVNERRITLLNKENKRIENYVIEVNLKANQNTSIVTGTYKDGTGYGMTTVADQANSAIANGKPVVAAVNADFYNMATGEPLGCFVKDGAVVRDLPSNLSFFGMRKDGTPVIGDYNEYMTERNQLQEAVGGLCKIVNNGNVVDYSGSDETYYTTKHPRTAVGIKADGSVIFMVSDGRQEPYSAGLTMYELGQLMRDLGCEVALNLDGGGSSTYLSREQGTDNLVCKNKPSDLTERTVANSLLILSKTPADHIFASATIAPFDITYTPNSKVTFSAQGMDASGASAALPTSGLYWKLSDDSFGTIDTVTGEFISNGKQGQFQVQLVKGIPPANNGLLNTSPAGIDAGSNAGINSESTTPESLGITQTPEIASSTYVEIQMPDTIFFKQTELSLEFDVSSDLNFSAQYKGRDVILKSGDIVWDIPFGMGTMDANNILHTSPDGSVSGAIKATLAGTALSVTLDAKVGQLPVVLYNFENGVDDWKPGSANRGEKVSLETVDYKSGEQVRFGDKSLKINFDLKAAQTGTTLGIYAGPGTSKEIPGAPKAIGAWIYATEEAQGYWMRMYVFDKNGQYKPIDFTTQKSGIDWIGWKYVQADIPSTYQGPFKTYPNQMIRMMSLKSGTTGPMTKGEVYVDNVRVVYGASVDDMYHPIINDINVDGKTLSSDSISVNTTFTDDMTDKYATSMNYDRINMFIDGKDYTNAPGIYALNKGQNTVSISGFKLPDGLHRADVVVQDKFGNETKKTAYFTVKTETGTTINLDSSNKDGAPLGGTYKININTNNSSDIKEVTAKIKIGKEFPVEGIDFGPGAADSLYNAGTDYSKGVLTLHIKNNSANTGVETLATINVKVPAASTTDQLLNYSVEYSDIVYNSDKGSNYYGSFCEMPASILVTSDYTVEVKDSLVGRAGVVIVKDKAGNPVEGALVKVVTDGTTTELGLTDANGSVTSTAMTDTVKKIGIYAEKNGIVSFTVNTQTLKPFKDIIPSNILSTAVENSSTSKKITWMSNPLTSEGKAIIQYAVKVDYDNSGETVFKDVEGTSVEKSFKGEIDINNNGIVKFNSAVLTGLTAGIEYSFRVGDGVNWSPVKEFKTTPEGSAATNFFVLGDTQTTDMTNLTSVLNSIAGTGESYDFAMHAGDIVDEASKFGQLDTVSSTLGAYTGALDTDLIPVLGNHEYMGDENGDIAKTFYNTPLNGPQENKGACYSVEYGNVYVAVISFTSDRNLLQAELDWLKKDAAKTTKTWKVLLTHQPVFYSNTEGGNGLFKEMLPFVMDEIGIDFVFSGHDHAYGRTKQLKAGQESPLGTTYYITGSTGTKYYGAVDDGSFAYFDDETQPVCITASATDSSMTIKAFRPDGTKVDTYTANKINYVNAKIENAETFAGGATEVKLKLSHLNDVAGIDMNLSYDATKLKFKSIKITDSLKVNAVNTETDGEITFAAVSSGGITVDQLEAATITFEANANITTQEQTAVNIVSAKACNSEKEPKDIYVEKSNGTVTIKLATKFSVENVTFTGEAVTGKLVKAKYTYIDPLTRPEQGTTFKWLMYDKDNDIYTPILGETSDTLLIKSEYAGKKIKVEVTVRNSHGLSLLVSGDNGRNTVLYAGDTDRNGTVDNNDILYILKNTVDKVTLDEQVYSGADINNDGKVDIRDIILLITSNR